MLQTTTRALARPQHPFDFAAHTAHALALLGDGAIRLALAIDTATAKHQRESFDAAARPRDRLGPGAADRIDRAKHGITDAWRLK